MARIDRPNRSQKRAIPRMPQVWSSLHQMAHSQSSTTPQRSPPSATMETRVNWTRLPSLITPRTMFSWVRIPKAFCRAKESLSMQRVPRLPNKTRQTISRPRCVATKNFRGRSMTCHTRCHRVTTMKMTAPCPNSRLILSSSSRPKTRSRKAPSEASRGRLSLPRHCLQSRCSLRRRSRPDLSQRRKTMRLIWVRRTLKLPCNSPSRLERNQRSPNRSSLVIKETPLSLKSSWICIAWMSKVGGQRRIREFYSFQSSRSIPLPSPVCTRARARLVRIWIALVRRILVMTTATVIPCLQPSHPTRGRCTCSASSNRMRPSLPTNMRSRSLLRSRGNGFLWT